MDKELDDLEELDELEELEELEEVAELEELEELPPEAESQAGKSSGPRELEKAPLMLKKAALILTIAGIFPWLVPSIDGAFPLERTLAKLVVLLGGYVMFMGVKRNHGAKVPGVFDSIGGMHPKALTILALVIMAVGIAPLIDTTGGFQAIVSKAAVAVGVIVLCQVQDYAMGGKFNPVAGLVIPMFGVGGLGRLVTVLKEFDPLALIGSAGVLAAGGLAGFTLFVAMKEAKEHGKAKKQAAVEARKRQRRAKTNR